MFRSYGFQDICLLNIMTISSGALSYSRKTIADIFSETCGTVQRGIQNNAAWRW